MIRPERPPGADTRRERPAGSALNTNIAATAIDNIVTVGRGRWASVSWCSGPVTVYRHATRSCAERVVDQLDRIGCGRGCQRRHEIVDLGGRS